MVNKFRKEFAKKNKKKNLGIFFWLMMDSNPDLPRERYFITVK